MPVLRFSRDKRGYESFFLVHSSPGRRGKSRSRILYFFRTPPGVKIGRRLFEPDVRRALEAQYPDVVFEWDKLLNTPIPSPDVERWKERRRQEKAAKVAAAEEAAQGEGRRDEGDRVEPGEVEAGAQPSLAMAPDTSALSGENGENGDSPQPIHAAEHAVAAATAAAAVADMPAEAPGDGRPRAGRRRRRRGGRRNRRRAEVAAQHQAQSAASDSSLKDNAGPGPELHESVADTHDAGDEGDGPGEEA